jgi:hypothetical protein
LTKTATGFCCCASSGTVTPAACSFGELTRPADDLHGLCLSELLSILSDLVLAREPLVVMRQIFPEPRICRVRLLRELFRAVRELFSEPLVSRVRSSPMILSLRSRSSSIRLLVRQSPRWR